MTTDDLLTPLLRGDRRALSRAITLVESTRPDHRDRAGRLIAALPDSTALRRLFGADTWTCGKGAAIPWAASAVSTTWVFQAVVKASVACISEQPPQAR